jgi:vitamin B12 transporter
MSNKSLVSAVALAAAGVPALSLAEGDGRNRLEETVVVASRIETPLRQVGTSVSVVTREDIEQLGFSSLYNVLRTQPGIGVTSQGGVGSVTSLRIRGEESYRTRYFLDGIDVSDTSSPQAATRIEHLMSSGVHRVEILRGPQGLMYGADAGGVVNITTGNPGTGFAGEASAEGGRYGTQQYAGNLHGGNERVDFSLMATDFETDGFNAKSTDTVLEDDDGYDNTTFHGRLGWNVTDDLRLSFVGRDIDSNNDYDDCFGTDDCREEYEQTAWRTGVNYQLGRFSHELAYNNSEVDRDYYSDDVFSFGAGGELERINYIGSFAGSESLTLVYGMEFMNESYDADTPDDERDQDSYYAEYQGGFNDRVFVTAGARYDDNDDFGSHTSYRASGAYLVPVADGEIKLRATYGTGFRAPSLSEVATNFSEWTAPPAFGYELSEEKSKGYDLAVSWAGDTGTYLELVYFAQEISDEIVYDFNSFGYLQVDGDTESTGVELVGAMPLLESFFVSANYTYTDSQDVDGNPRARRPEHMANLGINWSSVTGRLVLGLNARLSRDAVDIDGTELDDYEVLDINASFLIGQGFSVYGRVENVTDEDYEEVPDYNTSGAAGYVGLRYTFE